MSSSAGSASLSSKTVNLPAQASSPAYSQAGPANSSDSASQRRSGGSGSFGAGSVTRHSSSARNDQTFRKQHKTQRRARLADDDAIAESVAMKSINSRKGQTSITHLMNFTLPPRPYIQQQHNYNHNQHRSRRNPTWGLGSGYHAVDKARYVHANYRFIVRPDRNYHAQAVDADVHVEWDSVLQVLASAETQSTSCPICLSNPVAPRMAKCGHIFCLPCLIRYMHSNYETSPMPEKRARWKKCPICEDSIYISEARPVRWFVGEEASMLQEGGDVLLKLLIRDPGNTLALPRDAGEAFKDRDDIPWYHVAEIMEYARFMRGGEDYMTSQYEEEVRQLQAQEKEDELLFGDDTTWTKKAVTAIGEATERLVGLGNPQAAIQHPTEKKPQRTHINFAEPADGVPTMYALERASKSGQSISNVSTTPSVNTPQNLNWETISAPPATDELADLVKAAHNLQVDESETRTSSQPQIVPPVPKSSGSRPQSSPFFFYHALPNFFLSSLDIRILKAAFGDFAFFPSTILPRVEHISTGHVVDDDLRKRAKYLAHLPYGCEVNFLECDWTDIINPTVLAQFSGDIGRRRKKNHEKEVREERERARAEKEEEDKKWASVRRKRLSVVEKGISDADFQPLALDEPGLTTTPHDATAISTSPPWGTNRTHSFATLATPGTSPDTSRTVWGTAAIQPSSSPVLTATAEQPLPDDGWLQDWEKDLLDNTEAIAMVAASVAGEGSSKLGAPAGPNKKKKNKKITLMSTNARRGA